MSNSNGKTRTPIALHEDLPEHLAEKLRQSARAHSERVRTQQSLLGAYPDPEQIEKFDEDVDLTDIIHLGSTHKAFDTTFDSFRGNRRGRGRQPQGRGGKQGGNKGGGNKGGGNKGGGSGGGGKRPLPNPQLVHAEVAQMLQNIPVAGMKGNVQIGETNCEFMDTSKVNYFKDSYVEMASRFHVLFLEEVEPAGVAALGKLVGYQAFASVANTRNQAVGFIVHPRMKVVGGPTTYTSIANVQGVPDLRPAFRLDLEDTVSGEKFAVVVLHLKSMRGGPAVTANVRYRQFALLVQDLGPNFVGLVGGDLNYKIDDPSCKEGDPMIQAGYTLLAAGDHSATQIMGSRIDGFFHKGMKSGLDFYRVVAYFANPNLKRSFTDHGTLSFEVLTASAKSNAGNGNSGSSGATDNAQTTGGADLPPLKSIIVRAAAGDSRKGARRNRK
jgi:hypothetical protein